MGWQHYSKLVVWQKAMDLTTKVYKLTKQLPKEEMYALAIQMKRAAVSVPSNIAEGHGRKSTQDFNHFLSIARGSCYELETQLLICLRLEYAEKDQIEQALLLCDEISRMITKLMVKKAPDICAAGASPKLQTPNS